MHWTVFSFVQRVRGGVRFGDTSFRENNLKLTMSTKRKEKGGGIKGIFVSKTIAFVLKP